jgi:2-polyprenyl-3-methyl-5-hydroxy-6-metoxy-1,4-benzoquinol methylase
MTDSQATAVREAREQRAWDDDGVWERCTAWSVRVVHVLEGANTRWGERRFEQLIAAAAPGARILDVGCGQGYGTDRLLEQRPLRVLGIDLSREMIATARERLGGDERVEFRRQSTEEPLPERFDLIVGRAILHHVDFREFLARAYRDNLRAGGRMLFMEPMGHPFGVAFHRLVRSAHSPDERPLRRADVSWMRREFPRVGLEGINLLSFPAGIVSTFVFGSAENALMRGADRLDRGALERAPWLAAYARQAIIVIDKPA